jgi:hypothetical protein
MAKQFQRRQKSRISDLLKNIQVRFRFKGILKFIFNTKPLGVDQNHVSCTMLFIYNEQKEGSNDLQ